MNQQFFYDLIVKLFPGMDPGVTLALAGLIVALITWGVTELKNKLKVKDIKQDAFNNGVKAGAFTAAEAINQELTIKDNTSKSHDLVTAYNKAITNTAIPSMDSKLDKYVKAGKGIAEFIPTVLSVIKFVSPKTFGK